jgi:hypothetical protein
MEVKAVLRAHRQAPYSVCNPNDFAESTGYYIMLSLSLSIYIYIWDEKFGVEINGNKGRRMVKECQGMATRRVGGWDMQIG